MKTTAIIYSENEFGKTDAKIANDLVRYSEKYKIIGVIDSSKTGQDAGDVLNGIPNGIPIFFNLDAALDNLALQPTFFIYGLAPTKPVLNMEKRKVFFHAIKNRMNIVNGFPGFFMGDREFIDWANEYGVSIFDVRKPIAREKSNHFTGQKLDLRAPIIVILEPDLRRDKRITAQAFVKSLGEEGLNAIFIVKEQTGLLQGARYGSAINMLSSGYVTSEVEYAIIEAQVNERPDIIIVEGQGSLGHSPYTSSCSLSGGALSDSVIVQHAPYRLSFSPVPNKKLNSLTSEIALIEGFEKLEVIAISFNHNSRSNSELETTFVEYEDSFGGDRY